MPKQRLDTLVVDRGLAESRERARRMILAGEVLVDGHAVFKAGHRYDAASEVAVKARPRFVGRGGDKLEAAFEAFDLRVEGRLCLDVGASTGGFTDCLLQHGARGVIAIDVGKGQLHWRLRNDPRVTVIEGFNARYLTAADLPAAPGFAVADVSFISLTKILPAVIPVIERPGELVALIKPQFEAGRSRVEKGGVVRDPAVRREVVERIRRFAERDMQLKWVGCIDCPVPGPAGNRECLAYMEVP